MLPNMLPLVFRIKGNNPPVVNKNFECHLCGLTYQKIYPTNCPYCKGIGYDPKDEPYGKASVIVYPQEHIIPILTVLLNKMPEDLVAVSEDTPVEFDPEDILTQLAGNEYKLDSPEDSFESDEPSFGVYDGPKRPQVKISNEKLKEYANDLRNLANFAIERETSIVL